MAYFEHEGCTLHYEEYGQGEPLVLLHGLGSSCQDWESSRKILQRGNKPELRTRVRSFPACR